MDFKSYIDSNASKINQEIDQILSDFLNQTKKTNIRLTPFALGLINSCKGGKRIRGTLVKLGYELTQSVIPDLIERVYRQGDPYNIDSRFRGNDSKEILKISAAFEILHAALLIHDDIMDKSPTRRGQPSLYKALGGPASPDERASRGGDHYGISQAINIGDIGLYLPIKIISDTSFLGEYKLKALSHLSQTIINTGWGQIMDIELGERGKGKGESEKDQTEFINLYKTAKYTIAGPLQLGSILAGANDKLLGELGEFGERLGIAFQIKDDILDGEAGSVDNARVKALEYAKEAKKVIPEISSDSKIRKLLEEMCEFMVNRDK